MPGYAKKRGLCLLLLPVPALTPLPTGITVALAEGLRNDVFATDSLT